MQGRSRRSRRREAARQKVADQRTTRQARHPLDRAREAARAAANHLTSMVEEIEAAEKANQLDILGLNFMAVKTNGAINKALSHGDRAGDVLRVLASDMKDLDAAHGDSLRAILERLDMPSNWGMGILEWTHDRRVGRHIDRVRAKAKAAQVRLGKLRRVLNTLAEEVEPGE